MRIKSSIEALREAGVLLDPAIAEGHIELPAIFGNSRPVEIEIGSGKGTFLLQRAADRPEINLLGIEWLAGYAALAADRAVRADLKNIRLLCADAEKVFAESLSDNSVKKGPAESLSNGSVQRVHIYFPDPWPKRRHAERRLIKSGFLQNLRRVLRQGGTLHLVTDHETYFRHMQRVVGNAEGFTVIASPEAFQVGSNFEKKYITEGREFHAITAIRYK